ncbi:response regulator transcription factor [Butyrivibrio sp. FCS006]|uniref:response regulator transcription factor n=2 Tax=unclassified Butyrivibrio TaxID=2639466 RepID=UPI000413DC02|nr:helix-turn-helix domain-containing protein [Butyrivibrio sp. FCS006]
MKKFNILLTDDEEPALLGLEEGVNWEKLDVEKIYKCHSKDTAVRMLKTYPIDILITDIEMPNGNGIELIRWLRENKPGVKAVFYTGHAEFAYAQEALRLGVEDYLLKPIPYDELEEIISRIEKKIILEEKSVDFSELAEDSAVESPESIVDTVKKLIAENLSVGNLQRDELAAMVHVSSGYLGRIFKKETGLAISDYIVKKRIAVAKQLLSKTSLSVTDVSNRVGFTYSSYFTKTFKEHTGMTPQEFRQQNKI